MGSNCDWSLFYSYNNSGFAESTFSTFNVGDSDVGPSSGILIGSAFENVTECSYIGHRKRFDNGDDGVSYEPTMSYWENIFARAIFFIIFEVNFLTVNRIKNHLKAFGAHLHGHHCLYDS